ncbi:MAG: hypothetical protein KC912_25490 [Proteobacteria bacterium]|nr:hypothetical protein [Pseudomonadota bacterium]
MRFALVLCLFACGSPESAEAPEPPQEDEAPVAARLATPDDAEKLEVVHRETPRFPDAARATAGDEPTDCSYRILVDTEGKAEDLEPLDCPEAFRESAETALAAWRWSPPSEATTFDLNIRYKLSSTPANLPEGIADVACKARFDTDAAGKAVNINIGNCSEADRPAVQAYIESQTFPASLPMLIDIPRLAIKAHAQP